jgi:two-component system, cell cycle response regulator
MSGRILIIEDNAMNRELMDYLLRSFGFETLKAVDGRIGFDVACREQPDLIVCDIQMPELDGYEFAKLARQTEALRAIPLVAVTAFAMVGDRDRVLDQGFGGYISKPIEPVEFIKAVNAFLPAHLRSGSADPAHPSSYSSRPVTSPTTILVLDDSPFNLELKRSLLEPHGYEVLTVDNAQAAFELAKQRRLSLIISDVGMSEGNGFDFIRRVKADPDLESIPFIFLSSTHWDEASRKLGLELGAFRYLQRPLDSALLLAEIQLSLEG